MDLDEEEMEATKNNREKKCEYCNLVSGEEKNIGNGRETLIMEDLKVRRICKNHRRLYS